MRGQRFVSATLDCYGAVMQCYPLREPSIHMIETRKTIVECTPMASKMHSRIGEDVRMRREWAEVSRFPSQWIKKPAFPH